MHPRKRWKKENWKKKTRKRKERKNHKRKKRKKKWKNWKEENREMKNEKMEKKKKEKRKFGLGPSISPSPSLTPFCPLLLLFVWFFTFSPFSSPYAQSATSPRGERPAQSQGRSPGKKQHSWSAENGVVWVLIKPAFFWVNIKNTKRGPPHCQLLHVFFNRGMRGTKKVRGALRESRNMSCRTLFEEERNTREWRKTTDWCDDDQEGFLGTIWWRLFIYKKRRNKTRREERILFRNFLGF